MSWRQSLVDKMEVRNNYRNLWHTDLTHATLKDCPFCCFAAICSPCASYLLRKRALHNDMSRYVCCAGYMPCSGRCGEQSCPEVCLCAEVLCFFPNSVQSTRYLLQDEYNLQNTKCDNFIIGFMVCLQQLSCIFSLVAAIAGSEDLYEIANILYCISDGVYFTVCACMQTQHKVEMDKWDGKFGPVDRPTAPPGIQTMSRIDQPIPPAAGYYPPAGYPTTGYPPADYPPPVAGYPPPGYPRA